MKKYMLTVSAMIVLGMVSCTDETTSVNEIIEVEKITDAIDKMTDSINVETDTSLVETPNEIEVKVNVEE